MTDPASRPATLSDPAFSELREAYESGKLVIFAGAGVSAAAGLPGWKRLVELLSERARARGVGKAALEEIAELTAARQFIDALSALKDCLGAPDFCTVIERHLDDRLIDEPDVARAIAALAPRLRAVLTTNIDHLFERAFGGRWPMLPRATGDIVQREHFILKLHGTLMDRSSWVFTREDYDRATFADPALKAAFTAFFHAAPILFVGYGLADDDFDVHLSQVRDFAGDQPPRHFALVSADSVKPHRRKKLETAGIRLIAYENPDGKHTAVVEMLRQLAQPAAVPTASVFATTRQLEPSEAIRLIEQAGFEVSTAAPGAFGRGRGQRGRAEDALDEALEDARTREPESSREVTFALRVLSCIGAGEGLGIWLRPRTPGNVSSATSVAAVLTLPEKGGFNLYLPAKGVASSGGEFIQLASKLREQGGTVYVYDRRMPEDSLAPGLERVGLREALAEVVKEPLRSHAQRCFSGWSDQDEQGFVAARARLYPGGEVLPVAEALDRALASPGQTLLLGDFGTGKSTHLRRRAALMAKAFLEAGFAAPAPVLLPLAGMELKLDSLAARHLPGLSGEALELAVELGLVIPFFDGLDEARLDPDEVAAFVIELLVSVSGEQVKVVLTSRKTFFPELARLRGGLSKTASPFALLEMEELDRSEVAEFVGRRTPSAEEKARVLERIRRTHDLTSLSKRPVLLELILKSQERLSSGELNATQLYQVATEDWLDSRKGSERQVVREHRRAFARGLARALFDSGAETVTHAKVMQFVMDVLGDRYDGQNADEAALEVRTAVFLAHEEEGGGFRFAHKSFLEYFLAVDISERLDAGREDALDLPRLTPEVVAFLAGLEKWKEHAASLRQILTRDYRKRVSENALLALYLAARERVGGGEALGKALETEVPEKARLAGAHLAEVELPWLSLPGADLSGADLSGARLAMADLRGARLERARLDHSTLDGALLDRARLVEASLFAASLVDASTAGTQWAGADCEGLIDLRAEGARGAGALGDSASLQAILHTRSGVVSVVAWSPDRQRLASGGADGTVRVWEARSGKLLHELKGHAFGVRTVAYAPDGASLASGGADGTVRVWEARSGKLLHELKGHAGGVRTVAYAPDGASLASGGADGTVRVWEARSGKLLHELKGHVFGVRTVAYAPDGASLASGGDDETVRVWEARSGKLLHELKGHAFGVRTVAYAPDGASLASGGADGPVRVWEARSGKLLHELKGHAGGVRTVAYAPDGASLASGGTDETVRVWEARSGKLLHKLKGHADWVRTVAYAPDGASLASGGDDGTVRVWEARSGKLLHELKGRAGGVSTVAYAPDGASLASGGADGTVRVWEARSGKLLHELKGHAFGVRTVAYAPDGASLASGGDDETVRVWEARSGKLLHELKGHAFGVRTVAYAPDGASLASGRADGTVRVWEARSGKLLYELKGHADWVRTVAYAPDGASLASGGADGTVRVWEARGGKLLHKLKGHARGVRTVAYAPDGASLASGGADGTVRVWEARSGKLLHELKGHARGVSTVAYAPDGASLASGGADGPVRVWEARSGKLLHELKGHARGVSTVAYAPDGASLASGGTDGPVRVWEARSGKLLHELKGHADWVSTVAYAPDGASLASGGDDGTVRVWTLTPVIRSTTLASSPEGWAVWVEGTAFFMGEGDFSQLLHFTSGACAMPAALWSPLFHRPEIIREALAGRWPDMKALGLETFKDCAQALQKERQRQGLVRRRAAQRTFQAIPTPSELPPLFTVTPSQFTLKLIRGESRPPVELSVRAARVSSGMSFSAAIHLGPQRLTASRVSLERSDPPADADTLRLWFDVPGPGDGVLTLTALSAEGTEFFERLPISFVPEIPFIAGPPIRNPRDLYGREDDLARIHRELERGFVSLIGEVRIGKSSLLNQLEQRLGRNCLLLSLQSYVGELDQLPFRMAELIAPEASREGSRRQVLERAISLRLEQLVQAQGLGARFTLLLDEAQYLAGSREVRNELRSLFQSPKLSGLRVLVAGPPVPMRALEEDPDGSPFLNMFFSYRLGPLSDDAVKRLLRTPLGDEYTVTDGAVERVIALSGGRPIIVQMLGYWVLDACLQARRFRVEAEDIDRAFDEKVFDPLMHGVYGYAGRWKLLPEQVREVLSRLAERPAEREGLDRRTLHLLDAQGLADLGRRRLDVEPPFLRWIQEVAT